MSIFKEELPHLTLHWRRLLRSSGRNTILILMFWLVVVLVFRSSGNFSIRSLHLSREVFMALTISGAFFCLLYAVAEGMREVADEIRGGSNGWHRSTMSDRIALLGITGASLTAALIPFVMLLVLYNVLPALLGVEFTLGWGYEPDKPVALMPETLDLIWLATAILVRLPVFALLSACLALTVRSRQLGRIMPVLLAFFGSTFAFWDQAAFLFSSDKWVSTGFSPQSGFWAEDSIRYLPVQLLLPLVVGGSLFMLFCHYLRNFPLTSRLFTILVNLAQGVTSLAGPAALLEYVFDGTNPLGEAYHQIYGFVGLALHFGLSLMFPTLVPVWRSPSDPSALQLLPNALYSAHLGQWGWVLFVPVYAGAAYWLWLSALGCLNRARSSA